MKTFLPALVVSTVGALSSVKRLPFVFVAVVVVALLAAALVPTAGAGAERQRYLPFTQPNLSTRKLEANFSAYYQAHFGVGFSCGPGKGPELDRETGKRRMATGPTYLITCYAVFYNDPEAWYAQRNVRKIGAHRAMSTTFIYGHGNPAPLLYVIVRKSHVPWVL